MANPLDRLDEQHLSPAEAYVDERLKRIEAGKLGPEYVQWLCSHKCNFRCSHCGTGAAEADPNEMNTKEAFKLVEDLGAMGTKLLSLTGGEPIVRDDVFQVLKHAKDQGIHVGFVTNGYAVEEVADQIAKVEVDSVLVSIDGFQEHHNEIRGMPDSYQRAIKALDILEDIGVTARGVSAVFLSSNEKDIPKIVEDVMSHGVTRMRIQAVVPEGRAKKMENTKEEIYRMLKLIMELRAEGYPIEACEGLGYLGPLEKKVRPYNFLCGCGYTTFTVNDLGLVQGCPAIDFPELNEGNIRERPLKDIWMNSFGRFRRTLYEDLPEKCHDCEYLSMCRGGCWLHRVNGEHCFIDEAKRVAEEML